MSFADSTGFKLMRERKTPAGITQQDLVAGKVFTYSGHFMRISHKGLKYDTGLKKDVETLKQWHYQRGEYLVNSDKDEKWLVTAIMIDRFYVFQPSFGKICILYSECEVVGEEPTV